MSEERTTWTGICEELDAAGAPARRYKCMEVVYGDGARIVEERYFDPDGRLDHRYAFAYAESGALSEKRMILGEDRDHGRWVYQTARGRVVSARWLGRDGQVEAVDHYTWSDDGRSALRVRRNVGEWRHEYDDAGREVRVTGALYSGAGIETTVYEFDAVGHLRRIEEHGLTRRVTTFAPGTGPPTEA